MRLQNLCLKNNLNIAKKNSVSPIGSVRESVIYLTKVFTLERPTVRLFVVFFLNGY